MVRRLLAPILRLLDEILARPPDDTEDDPDAAGRVARLRLRLRLTEKRGHGGNR